MRRRTVAGTPPAGKRRVIALKDTVGQTIVAVEIGVVEGANGNEPCIWFVFQDGSEHGIVMPSDNW